MSPNDLRRLRVILTREIEAAVRYYTAVGALADPIARTDMNEAVRVCHEMRAELDHHTEIRRRFETGNRGMKTLAVEDYDRWRSDPGKAA